MAIRLWMKRGLLLLLAAVIAISLKACDLSQFTTAEAATSRIVFSSLGDPKTFNPTLSQEYPNIFLYTFQGLTSRDGETGELIPLLAESWDISENGKTYTITLRENLRWSDGEPLTADDVMFTYRDVIFNEAIPAPSRDTFRVGEEGILPTIEKLSDRQVAFKLPEPFAPFLVSLAAHILPAHALQESVTTLDGEGNPMFLSTWTTGTPPEDIVTNGPYQLKEYLPSQRVIFERNPYYWGEGADGEQQPYIQQLIWQIIEDSDNQLLQFRSGGLDVIGVSPDEFALMKQEEERGNFTIYEGGPALGTTFMAFNLNKASRNGEPLVDPIKSRWFNSLAFRRAVSHAIDRPTMVNNIYQGLGAPQTSPVPVQSPFYAGPDEGVPVYEYDLDKARELLEQDGFQYNSDGQLLDAEGNRVRFTLITNSGNKIREALGAQIKQDLSRIGIQVDFQPISFNALVTKLGDSLDWDAHIIGFTASLDPHSGAVVWLLDGSLHAFNQQALPGQEPLEGWEAADWEKEIANLYIRAARETDFEQRRQLYVESQRLAEENLPFIHLVNPYNLGAVRNTLGGVNYSGIVRPFAMWNVEELTAIAE
ncbi:ABC transporter substrate-binding protein [Oscillatoria sp. CS-180]|uniref:ABC transporter substrate-binding protein n=1 Tax=Oscillatoria sp. CS-180 TaxID=3021720 RepID=UPI00232B6B4C|nr:ABC transporter substrate-binding protein [Oscillatoria sp. CS-180]MDB9526701.1 ABC transporter substrate-binding protein [Oscillatoria sp. CS-180]